MSRHSDNLERLCNKLRCRYGTEDSLVLELKAELEACKAKASNGPRQQHCEASNCRLFSVQHLEFARRISS
jgi:hypothetical protein